MSRVTHDQVLALLRDGTAEQRQALVRSLPANTFRNVALSLLTTDNPWMVIVAMAPLVQQYSFGSNPEIGIPLASALHERALELYRTVPDHGLLLSTLSSLAYSHVKALSLLGQAEEILDVTASYIPLYEDLNEPENLPSLRVLRIEAFVTLERYDEAAHELKQHPELKEHPICGMEARRLTNRVEAVLGDIFTPKDQEPPASPSLSPEELINVIKTTIGLSIEGAQRDDVLKAVKNLASSHRLDHTKPKDFATLLEILKEGGELLSKHGAESEITVRRKIREASAIFVHGTPSSERILASLDELDWSLRWAKEHGIHEIENDANWGRYLCHSRLGHSSDAADALIRLRDGLERRRTGIQNPLERAGIFGDYRYLFNAMCEHLYKAGRPKDLLEAIESSKGRAIADKLTEQFGDIVPDNAIYGCVRRLPELTREHGFHYLSYFVDDEWVYAVLVDKQGNIHMPVPIEISSEQLRKAALTVDPRVWGRPQKGNPTDRIADVSQTLEPMVAWMSDLIDRGVIDHNDHVVYSADESFSNVPLHYIRLRDGLVLDWCSVSRVHSAFNIDHVLRLDSSAAQQRYVGFAVPARQDIEEKPKMAKDFSAPLKCLDECLPGTGFYHDEATIQCVRSEELDQRIVHFSTHGWFPEDGNPFRDSYLLLATAAGLPNKEAAARGDRSGWLTPQLILSQSMNFSGSHVSLMACVSGMAREGIAGDTLGLDWAFLQAGASSLISTHWPVSAACAAEFFRRFYYKWLKDGNRRAVAIREAMRELMAGDASPASLYQWAPFSLTGDFR